MTPKPLDNPPFGAPASVGVPQPPNPEQSTKGRTLPMPSAIAAEPNQPVPESRHLHKWSGEYQYENLLLDVLQNGVPSNDRTGVGTISLFGTRMEFDLSEAFPLIASKKVFIKGVIYELLWFLKGDTNVRWLQEARSAHLRRMGGRERRSGTHLRMPVAQLADRPGRHRPDRRRHRDHPRRPALTTHHRQ